MNTSAELRDCGLKSINQQNPKGLLKKGETIYQLHGFINYMDGRDSAYHHDIYNLQSLWANEVMHYGFNHGKYRDLTHLCTNGGGNGQFNERVIDQLKPLGLRAGDYIIIGSRSAALFVFTIHAEPLSFMTKVTVNPKQAIFDYVDANKHVPHMISDYRLALTWSESQDFTITNTDFYIDHINSKSLVKLFNEVIVPNNYIAPTHEELEEKRQLAAEEACRNETVIEKFSDYTALSQKFNVDIHALHKRIVSKAKRLGGFVNFTYKGQTFEIPKIALIAWSIRDQSSKFEYNGDTWRAVSPENLKTDADDAFHSDWWIGAGIPLSAYDLHGTQYSHAPFNKALSSFAADLVKRNTLDSFTILSGSQLPPVSGKLKLYPSSVDNIEDGDIIVLPHGGIEFDAYLKKACGNGNGAVIVEIGNRVAHLSIVANEMGYRVIQLPNAYNLLLGVMRAHVDTQEVLIKPLKGKSGDYALK
jgi:hypothetical protein